MSRNRQMLTMTTVRIIKKIKEKQPNMALLSDSEVAEHLIIAKAKDFLSNGAIMSLIH